MNSIPIVTQLDIFEPRQETERCRRGSPGRSTSNHPGLARKTGGYAMKKTSTRARTYAEQLDDSRRLTRTRSAAFARRLRIDAAVCARAASGHAAAAPPRRVMNVRLLIIRSPRRRAAVETK